jgi:predicted transcriptional regulator
MMNYSEIATFLKKNPELSLAEAARRLGPTAGNYARVRNAAISAGISKKSVSDELAAEIVEWVRCRPDLSHRKIAEMLGIGRGHVSYVASKRKVLRHAPRAAAVKAERDASMVDEILDGKMFYKDIAKRHDVSMATVLSLRGRENLPHRTGWEIRSYVIPPISPQVVDSIAADWLSGKYSYSEMSKRNGVCPASIWNVVNRQGLRRKPRKWWTQHDYKKGKVVKTPEGDMILTEVGK